MAEVTQRSNIQIWQDVIFAIFIREIRSKFDDKIGISWALVQPVSFIFILSFIRGMIDDGYTHTMPTFIFMMYGMIIIQLFISTLSSTAKSIAQNKALFAFRQVQPIAAVIANAVFELLTKIGVIFILALLVYLMKIDALLVDPLTILFIIFQVWLCAISIGLMFAITKAFVIEIDKVRVLLTRPLFFISAVFFSLQDIPQQYWSYLTWNPILHAIELTRNSAYPSYHAQGVTLEYLTLSTFILFAFALAIYSISWKKVVSR